MVVHDLDRQAMQPPLLTVAMPVYNAGKYLRMAVMSIVKQTFADWELLIIDDGSTDEAFQDIADIQDGRIQVIRDGVNKGLAARLNECIDLARGQYFARMDSDDASYPERLARQIAALQKEPELDLVATRAIMIDENDQVTGLFPYAIAHEEICAKPWQGFYFPHPSWMGRTAWFRKYRYAEPSPYFCEDQELLLRSYRNSRFTTLDEILFAYRIRSNVNWKKLAGTRSAVWDLQMQQFARLHQWCFIFLATAVYLAKMSGDLLNRLWRGGFKTRRDLADNDAKFKWHKIHEALVASTA